MPLRSGLKRAVASWLVSTGLFDEDSVVVANFLNRKVAMTRGMALVSAPSHPVTIHRQYGAKTELYSVVVSCHFFHRDHAGSTGTELADSFAQRLNEDFDTVRKELWDRFSDRSRVVGEHFNGVRLTILDPEMPDQQNTIVNFVIEIDVTRKVSGEDGGGFGARALSGGAVGGGGGGGGGGDIGT